MAKLLASTVAMDAAVFAMQLTGSHGAFSAQPFARYLLDAKVSQLTGGSVEILRNTVARELLGKESTAGRPGGKGAAA
jgi:alkylation response protein AidB-like acyl-CoA dehydrogenase